MRRRNSFLHNTNVMRGYSRSIYVNKYIREDYDEVLDGLQYSVLGTMYKAIEEIRTKIYPVYGISRMALMNVMRTRIMNYSKDELRKAHFTYHVDGPEKFVELILYPNGKPKKPGRKTKEGNRRSTIFDE